MKKTWSAVLAIAFVAILLGAIAIGVGYLTGADIDQVYTTLAASPVSYFIHNLIGYWNEGYAWAQQFIADFPALLAQILPF